MYYAAVPRYSDDQYYLVKDFSDIISMDTYYYYGYFSYKLYRNDWYFNLLKFNIFFTMSSFDLCQKVTYL